MAPSKLQSSRQLFAAQSTSPYPPQPAVHAVHSSHVSIPTSHLQHIAPPAASPSRLAGSTASGSVDLSVIPFHIYPLPGAENNRFCNIKILHSADIMRDSLLSIFLGLIV